MKARQSGGPAKLVHRCFVVYGSGLIAALLTLLPVPSLRADGARTLDDFAQIYVSQYFEPDEHLALSDASKDKSQALAHYALGRGLEVRGRTEEAIAAYSEVLRHQPDQFFLARKTAHLLAREGRQEEALALLEESLERNAGHPYAHISLSEYLATYHGGDPVGLARAIEVVENAVALFPDNPAVYEHLVKLLVSADRRDDARAAVMTAAKRDNDDPHFWLRLGRLAVRVMPSSENGGTPDTSLVDGIYAKALDFSEGKAEVIEKVAEYYHAAGQLDRAISAYAGILQSQPDRLDLRERLARAYGAKGDGEKEIETYRSIVEIDPENADIHKRIAGILLQSERHKEAIPHLQAALSITKGSAEEYRALGAMMIDLKEHEASVEFLEAAAYLFPEAADFPFLLTFAFAGGERWEEALKQFEKTLDLAGEAQPHLLNEHFYFRYAAAHERHGNFGKAEDLFRKTIEMIAKNDPNDENQEFTATVYNYLGYMWLENDMKIDEAGELIKTAVELDPDSGAIADSLGWFYFKKGKYEEAKDELLRAETLIEQEDAVIYDHIGQVFHQLGDREKAVEYLEKAVALDPEKEEYAERLDEYKTSGPKKSETPAASASEAVPSAPGA